MAPANALSMLKSEVSLLITSMKCSSRSNYRTSQEESRNCLLKNLKILRKQLSEISDIDDISPLTYLTPFLDVIRSETTSGPITGLALTSVEKFLAYGLLEASAGGRKVQYYQYNQPSPAAQDMVGVAIETVAEAVIQARFIRSGLSSDEVVLMKIVHLLRTLMLVPAGYLLSNEMVFEILQNCLRICLETKLSELLRRTAEQFLCSIVQLFFSRLPALIAAEALLEQPEVPSASKTPRMFSKNHFAVDERKDPETATYQGDGQPAAPTDGSELPPQQDPEADISGSVCSLKDHLVQQPSSEASQPADTAPEEGAPVTFVRSPSEIGMEASECQSPATEEEAPPQPTSQSPETDASPPSGAPDDVSKCPVVLNNEADSPETEITAAVVSEAQDPNAATASTPRCCRPYTLRAVHDLFAVLTDLLNPEQHPEPIVQVSLGLLTVALETGADFIPRCPSLMQLVATDMTKYLMMLLYRERIQLFAHAVRVCFLLFEALRGHLKLQLEVYFQRLIAIISSESDRISYEHREIALEAVTQLFLLPGLAAEIYVNYDCDPYCSNLFEDITDMLTKNAYPMARLMSTHILSLDALLAVINAIDAQCVLSDGGGGDIRAKTAHTADAQASQSLAFHGSKFQKKLRPNRHWTDPTLIPTQEQLNAIKIKKKVLMIGSDRFNIKPKDGIAYLQRHGLLSDPLDPLQMAAFLSENPRLDKRTIGEFLSARKNSEILYAFVRHFNFGGTRIDEALRAYLEAFRIPGEAPLIQHLMEHFAEQWFQDNDAPFANADAAFTLSYAILMLNTDQHNPNSKRQNVPMTVHDFRKNLKGMNGGGDFEPELIEAIYQSIRNNEIVMPSEQTGTVRENYLWKCLVRRSEHSSFTQFLHIPPGSFDADLFTMIWGPSVSALSFIFDKTTEVEVQAKAICGFVRCASIAAHYRLVDVFDNLTISLCKFTTLMSPFEYPEQLPVVFGRNRKAQLATRLVFALVSAHADILRDGWRSLVDCLLQLFRADLLPAELVESVDYVASGGQINLYFGRPRSLVDSCGLAHSRSESGMLSSFYQYFSLGSSEREVQPVPAPAVSKAVSVRLKTSEPAPAPSSLAGPNRESSVAVRSSQLSTSASSSAANLLRLIDQACSSDQLSEHQFPVLDEVSAAASAKSTAENCQVAVLIEETKFMMDASLQEFIKALLSGLYGEKYDLTPIDDSSSGGHPESDLDPSKVAAASATTMDRLATTPPPPAAAAAEPVPIDSVHRSLHALVTSFIPPQFLEPPSAGSRKPSAAAYYSNKPGSVNERSQAFCLELIVRILLFNRDRVGLLWPLVRGNLVEMLMVAREPCFLVERVITGLLQLALRLIRRQNLTVQIFACLYFIITHRGQFLLQPPSVDVDRHQRHQRHHQLRPLSPVGSGGGSEFGRPGSGLSGRIGSVGGGSAEGETRSSVARQIVCGLATLLLENAAEFPSSSDWQLVFGLLEICGAGAFPICGGDLSDVRSPAQEEEGLLDSQKRHGVLYSSLQSVAVGESESLRGYASDNERDNPGLTRPSAHPSHSILASLQQQTAAAAVSGGHRAGAPTEVESWVLVNVQHQQQEGSATTDPKDSEGGKDVKEDPKASAVSSFASSPLVPSSVLHMPIMIVFSDLFTLEKAVDSIAFLVRDPAHITPNSIEYCVHALRVFVEACSSPSKPPLFQRHGSDPNTAIATARDDPITGGLALQLLDLVYTLFSRAPSIYAEWTKTPSETTTNTTATEIEKEQQQQSTASAPENSRLWPVCWRSLLQSIARLCVDCRREVRSDALAFLQRALLSPILHIMTGQEWEDCFLQVLFPLLTYLLETDFLDEARRNRGDMKAINAGSSGGDDHDHSGGGGGLGFFSGIFGVLSEAPGSAAPVAEYTDPRMRAIPLLTKIFLQHLKPLYGLETFQHIWMRLLAYMEAYLRANISDSLNDAVRESLKNLLLVMYTGTQDTPPLLVREASPQTREGQLWCQTQHQLATFLPSLMDQLFPPPPPPTPAPALPATAATTTTLSGPPEKTTEAPFRTTSSLPEAQAVAAASPSPPPTATAAEPSSLVPETAPPTETIPATAAVPTVIPGAVRIAIPLDFEPGGL